MTRVLVIDQDRATAQRLDPACVARGITVTRAENVCEAVRLLATSPASLIVVDHGLLRLGPAEHARLFDQVAPGVPTVVLVRPGTGAAVRRALETAGFRVRGHPLAADDVAQELCRAPGGAACGV